MTLSLQSLLIGGVGILSGLGIGVWLCDWWDRRTARLKRRIPKSWPLAPRAVANTQERIVWLWMTQTFFDHAVMIKLPVTRFTQPRTLEHGQNWYHLLSNAYCTFTIVDAGARVVGCVDVANPLVNTKRSQILKRSLLDQCGIRYIVVDAVSLPEAAEVRAEFLGIQAERKRAQSAINRSTMHAASDHLRASLSKQRKSRPSDRAPLSADSESMSKLPSEFTTDDSHILHAWQANSFLSPLDSRKADL